MATNQTVCRLLIGNELRRIREERNLKQEDGAKHIGTPVTKVSRLELGQTRVAVAEIKMLLDFYGDEQQHIDAMLNLARTANKRGHWQSQPSEWREPFRLYVDLEEGAEDIRQAQAEVVPGLLQAEPYMRITHAQAMHRLTDSEVEANVTARLERQTIFTKDDAPTVSFVLSESCLRRQVGGPDVMRAQLDHLVEMARLPNVQIQVLPFATKTYPGATSFSFHLLEVGAPGIASPLRVAYVEDYDDARYLDDKDTVRAYGDLWRRLTAAALGPAESVDFIRAVAGQHQ